MKDYTYLYGDYKDDIVEIPQEVIQNRISLLDLHLSELLEVHYSERDTTRIKAVCDAIDFWKNINSKDMR